MTELLELSDKDFKVAIIKMLSLETNDKIESQKRNRKIQQRYKIKTKWKFRTEKQNDHNKKKNQKMTSVEKLMKEAANWKTVEQKLLNSHNREKTI